MIIKDKLKLVRIVSGARSRFFVGVYSDKKKKYIIKKGGRKSQNKSFRDLIKEYKISDSLSRIVFDSINIPKVVAKYQSRNEFSIVYEYINGDGLYSYPLDYQVIVVKKCIDELASINQSEYKTVLSHIPKKRFINYIISLPIFYFLFLLHSHKEWKILTKSFMYCICNIKKLYFEEMEIAHCDIKPENIIIAKKEKIYLLDCEQMIMTKAGYDFNKIIASNINPRLTATMKKKYPSLINKVLLNYICLNYGSSYGKKSTYTENYISSLHSINS